jgi:hypothetical protein
LPFVSIEAVKTPLDYPGESVQVIQGFLLSLLKHLRNRVRSVSNLLMNCGLIENMNSSIQADI